MPVETPEEQSYMDLGFDKYMRTAVPGRAATGTGRIGSSLNLIDNMSYSSNLGSSINVGGTNLRIEGGQGRIIINDGQTDRIIIGNLG